MGKFYKRFTTFGNRPQITMLRNESREWRFPNLITLSGMRFFTAVILCPREFRHVPLPQCAWDEKDPVRMRRIALKIET
ncbi:hypothetical protein CDAR_167501 [Caerostris darwini]|uniref:Uncharacterized protein n=1 Tax=Caerostris darwini TaxID=1538125 RepID=A0AAV4NFT3_9ARAC|nr:hypothetical protein CDAR_167501 [Caerostris darwini]